MYTLNRFPPSTRRGKRERRLCGGKRAAVVCLLTLGPYLPFEARSPRGRGATGGTGRGKKKSLFGAGTQKVEGERSRGWSSSAWHESQLSSELAAAGGRKKKKKRGGGKREEKKTSNGTRRHWRSPSLLKSLLNCDSCRLGGKKGKGGKKGSLSKQYASCSTTSARVFEKHGLTPAARPEKKKRGGKKPQKAGPRPNHRIAMSDEKKKPLQPRGGRRTPSFPFFSLPSCRRGEREGERGGKKGSASERGARDAPLQVLVACLLPRAGKKGKKKIIKEKPSGPAAGRISLRPRGRGRGGKKRGASLLLFHVVEPFRRRKRKKMRVGPQSTSTLLNILPDERHPPRAHVCPSSSFPCRPKRGKGVEAVEVLGGLFSPSFHLAGGKGSH